MIAYFVLASSSIQSAWPFCAPEKGFLVLPLIFMVYIQRLVLLPELLLNQSKMLVQHHDLIWLS